MISPISSQIFFFFNDPAPTEFSSLPLPDALPISPAPSGLEPELIERAQQFGRIAVDAIGTGTEELGFPVAATQQPDAQNPRAARRELIPDGIADEDRKSTRLNSSHLVISYAVFCL